MSRPPRPVIGKTWIIGFSIVFSALFGICLLGWIRPTTAESAPPNDHFAKAQVISGDSGNLEGATYLAPLWSQSASIIVRVTDINGNNASARVVLMYDDVVITATPDPNGVYRFDNLVI